MRQIFSKKFENSPLLEPWIIYGIQGVDTSYVSTLSFEIHFFLLLLLFLSSCLFMFR